MSEANTQTITQVRLKDPSMWTVVIHNDDYTPMDFVEAILINYFHKSAEEAARITLTIHHEGLARVGLFTKEIAIAKVQMVTQAAEQYQHPLRATPEEA